MTITSAPQSHDAKSTRVAVVELLVVSTRQVVDGGVVVSSADAEVTVIAFNANSLKPTMAEAALSALHLVLVGTDIRVLLV